MEYVTIASTGNAKDFGDLTRAQNYAGGCSSAIRGLLGVVMLVILVLYPI